MNMPSAQNQDRFICKIAASIGCDDDCEEGETSVWQDEDMAKKLNFRNNIKSFHTQQNDWWRKKIEWLRGQIGIIQH